VFLTCLAFGLASYREALPANFTVLYPDFAAAVTPEQNRARAAVPVSPQLHSPKSRVACPALPGSGNAASPPYSQAIEKYMEKKNSPLHSPAPKRAQVH